MVRTTRKMRRFANELIDPLRVPIPADPGDLLDALVESATRWRGRPIAVHLANFPPQTSATGLWIDRGTRDDIVIEADAPPWMKLVILGHELWHMADDDPAHRAAHTDGALAPAGADDAPPTAARTRFLEAAEQRADLFGMLIGDRLRPWLKASPDSVYAAHTSGHDDLAGRIGAALNYRGAGR
ncbi:MULTISPECIES: toxin [unclassified Streptomyces]|uniref:toxin n=1 Tax=unclassified Streptomyces TaxID=2593676 RepID=UPI0027D8CCFE|nr:MULTISPECIES: toxin [unclassified Streptomyces]